MPDGICFQKCPVPRILYDDTPKRVLAPELGAVSFQKFICKGRRCRHVIAKSLSDSALGLWSSTDMNDVTSGVVNDIDTSAIGSVQLLA